MEKKILKNYNKEDFEELFKMFDSSDSLDEQMTQGIFLGFSKEEVKECLKVWEDITNVKYKTI